MPEFRLFRLCGLCAAICVISMSAVAAYAEDFQSIFDGKTLAGWKARDMSYWSVKDGAITAESTEEHPCKSNQFIVWQGGDVADFELKLKFRVTGNGCNSGVQFRSKIRPDGLAVGYQADIYKSGSYLGGVCDEMHSREGPELLTANGAKTVIDANGKRTATSLEQTAKMNPFPEWNDYHITARGQHIILEINGVKSSELIDQEEEHFDLGGILGLQLRSGRPMKVQFKDVYLKQFSTNESTPGESPRDEFTQLFDGKSLDGWHLENDARFVAEDGVLKHKGGLGWLRSDRQYSDFVFELEFRFLEPKQDGGVFLRANSEGKNWPSEKYEVQIENTERMARIFGAPHDLDVDLTKKSLKPDGEWNKYVITAQGSGIEVQMNGSVVSKTNRAGGLTRGYIGLQGENGAHEYRNFRIKELIKKDP